MFNTEVFLPFDIPRTAEAQAWLEELDWLDLHEGPEAELVEVACRAPSESARLWLQSWILHRQEQIQFLPPCIPLIEQKLAVDAVIGAACRCCVRAGASACIGCEVLGALKQG